MDQFLVILLVTGCASSKFQLTKTSNEPLHFEDLQKIYDVVDASLSPNADQIVYIANKNKYSTLWLINTKDGTEKEILDLGRPIRGVNFSPAGKYLVIMADNDGDENYRIYTFNFQTKSLQALGTEKKSRNYFCGFKNNSDTFTFSSNERDERYFDLKEQNLDDNGLPTSGVSTFVRSNDFNSCGKYSPDGKNYIFAKVFGNSYQELNLYDSKTRQVKRLSPKVEAQVSRAIWTKNGDAVYSISNLNNDYSQLLRFDLSGKWTQLTKTDWDVENFSVSENYQKSAYVINEDGVSVLKVFEGEFKKPLSFKLPVGVINFREFSKDGNYALLQQSTTNNPDELYLLDVTTGDCRKITQLNRSGLDLTPYSDPQLVRLTSKDGTKFSAFLHLPPGASESKPVPAMVWVHGGPEDQFRPYFSPRTLYFMSRGFAIIAPNFRGSTGYGTRFRKSVYKDWGGKHIDDLIATAEYANSRKDIKSSKIGILGGSFGGFAVLSAITNHPDLFCSAVDIFGPVNLISFLDSMPPSWKLRTKDLIGDPIIDRDFLIQRSPITHLHRIKTPLLVIQGKNDPRVSYKESEQVVESMRTRKQAVDYILFENEGHGFERTENANRAYTAAADHIFKYCQ